MSDESVGVRAHSVVVLAGNGDSEALERIATLDPARIVRCVAATQWIRIAPKPARIERAERCLIGGDEAAVEAALNEAVAQNVQVSSSVLVAAWPRMTSTLRELALTLFERSGLSDELLAELDWQSVFRSTSNHAGDAEARSRLLRIAGARRAARFIQAAVGHGPVVLRRTVEEIRRSLGQQPWRTFSDFDGTIDTATLEAALYAIKPTRSIEELGWKANLIATLLGRAVDDRGYLVDTMMAEVVDFVTEELVASLSVECRTALARFLSVRITPEYVASFERELTADLECFGIEDELDREIDDYRERVGRQRVAWSMLTRSIAP